MRMIPERSVMASLISRAYEIFAEEPQLVELELCKYLIVGDTHGDLDTSLSAIRYAERNNLSLIFLGDYVDRGPRQLENIITLLEHKLSWGRGLIMLRGNHESRMMNRWYGFSASWPPPMVPISIRSSRGYSPRCRMPPS